MKIVDLFAGLEGWSGSARSVHQVVSTDVDPRFGSDITADVLEPDLGERLVRFLGGKPDLVLASPPCEAFSVLRIGPNWTKPDDVPPHQPKTDEARFALRLVERTRELIAELDPTFFVIENPRAKLRKLPVVADLERRTVTYCRLGEPFMKPTDLWGGFPPSLVLPEPCDTRGGRIETDEEGLSWVIDADGNPCHISAPRGSRTGIQGEGVLVAQAAIPAESRIASRRRRGGLAPQKDLTRRYYGTSDAATLAALRAKVPDALSRLVIDAAERDIVAGRMVETGTLW